VAVAADAGKAGIGGGRSDASTRHPLLHRHLAHSVQPPLLGDAFERNVATILELDAGTCHEILDRARHEHFARLSLQRDARADVDGDAANLLLRQLALAGMQTGANLETELSQAFSDRPPALDGARGAVDGGVAAWRLSDAWRGGARPAPPAPLAVPTRNSDPRNCAL